MERLGGSLADVVHVTLFVTDIADVFEIDRAWRLRFGDAPPARTLIPVRGVGVPRREAEGMGHADRAVKLEQQVRALRPGHGVRAEAVTTAAGRLAHEAEAVRAGSLVWLSHQYPRASAASGSVEEQVHELFDRLGEVCEAAGTDLANLVQLRVFALEADTGHAVSARLRELVPADPPVVAVTTVPGPLLVPGAALFVDAVAFAG
jgi:enamine deaminase RidA (YjgF/YER057c/UK114 family)